MKTVVRLLVLLLFTSNTFAQENDSFVLYKPQIDWSVFKGVPNSDSLGARISTSIYLGISKVSIWNGTILFKASAQMNPFESWVKPAYADTYTLQHEQTHFTITEICARGLEAELNRMKIKRARSPVIQATFAKWQAKMEDLQNQYDAETKGGNDATAQQVWNQKILAEVNKQDKHLLSANSNVRDSTPTGKAHNSSPYRQQYP